MNGIIAFLRQAIQSPSFFSIVIIVIGVALLCCMVFVFLGPFLAPKQVVALADFFMQWAPNIINRFFQRSYYQVALENAKKKEKKYIKYKDNPYVQKK